MNRQPTNIKDRLAFQAIRNAERAKAEATHKAPTTTAKPGSATAAFVQAGISAGSGHSSEPTPGL